LFLLPITWLVVEAVVLITGQLLVLAEMVVAVRVAKQLEFLELLARLTQVVVAEVLAMELHLQQ
jgi:hypothetical protein